MNISVAMAVYNGMPYLKEQLASIIEQLEDGDELVISDSGSSDGSLDMLIDFAASRQQINLVHCTHKRPISPYIAVTLNFQNAVNQCINDVVVLCDQDDVWLPGRLAFVREAHTDMSVSCSVVDGLVMNGSVLTQERLSESKPCRGRALQNFYRLTVLGCQLSFRKSSIPRYLNVPRHRYITHDWWWYVNLCSSGTIVVSKEALICYRRHDKNNSLGLSRSGDSFMRKVYKRLIFLKHMFGR